MNKKKTNLSRRDYLKTMGSGILGGVFLGMVPGCDSNTGDSRSGSTGRMTYGERQETATVSLVKGDERRKIIYSSLMNLKDDIVKAIGKKKVLIKPNLVLANRPGCETDPDAARGVLDFLREHTKAEVIIGESTADRDFNTMKCFEGYGYFPVRDEYGVELVDLNLEPFEKRFILSENNAPVPIRVIRAFLDPDIFLISLARMKVHVHAYVTLSLKNVLLAAPLNDYTHKGEGWTTGDKYAMHTNPDFSLTSPLFYNMFLLSQHVFPDLGVIDGYEGMSDQGPIGGRMVDSHVAVTSLDALAADVVGTLAMGLDPSKAPFFNYMREAGMGQGDPGKINIVGTPLADCIYPYKACSSFDSSIKPIVQELFPKVKTRIHDA